MQFISQPEGYIKPHNGGYLYVYQYKDHLGNIRLSYADLNNNGSIESGSEILEENNYYPFGLRHKGYNEVFHPQQNSVGEKYKFGGKEWNDELDLNLYDFHARNYDPAIGRWLSVDPLAEDFTSWTPYHYVHNNPINLVDPTGMSAEPPKNGFFEEGYTHTDIDGSWTFENGAWYNDNSLGGTNFLPEIVIETVSKDAVVNVLTETDGIGHTYIQIGNYVFSNGRYNGSDSPSMGTYGITGDNVLVKYYGKEATEFLNRRMSKSPTLKQEINNINVADVFNNLNNRYNNGVYNNSGSGVIDGRYNLFLRNCTTCTIDALNAGGGNFNAISPKALPLQIKLHNLGINPKDYFQNIKIKTIGGLKL